VFLCSFPAVLGFVLVITSVNSPVCGGVSSSFLFVQFGSEGFVLYCFSFGTESSELISSKQGV
jgi:hypothetical protein